MKIASEISLRLRITLLTGAILIFCSLILSITASYNAHSQFSYLTAAGPISAHLSIIESDTLTDSGSIPKAVLTASAVTEAKKKFDSATMIILAIVSMLGMALVYLFAGRSLRPIHNLSQMISAITEDDLRKRIPYEKRNDEVGQLGQSFNIMLDRLEKSFSQQKRFSANACT